MNTHSVLEISLRSDYLQWQFELSVYDIALTLRFTRWIALDQQISHSVCVQLA